MEINWIEATMVYLPINFCCC